jgi:hypothetical protein
MFHLFVAIDPYTNVHCMCVACADKIIALIAVYLDTTSSRFG